MLEWRSSACKYGQPATRHVLASFCAALGLLPELSNAGRRRVDPLRISASTRQGEVHVFAVYHHLAMHLNRPQLRTASPKAVAQERLMTSWHSPTWLDRRCSPRPSGVDENCSRHRDDENARDSPMQNVPATGKWQLSNGDWQ